MQHAVWKIEINGKIRFIKALGEKLRQGKLSKEEHLQYGQMITEVKALERRVQTEGRTGAHERVARLLQRGAGRGNTTKPFDVHAFARVLGFSPTVCVNARNPAAWWSRSRTP